MKCVLKGRRRKKDGTQMWKAFLYLGPKDLQYLGSYESPEIAEAKVKAAEARRDSICQTT